MLKELGGVAIDLIELGLRADVEIDIFRVEIVIDQERVDARQPDGVAVLDVRIVRVGIGLEREEAHQELVRHGAVAVLQLLVPRPLLPRLAVGTLPGRAVAVDAVATTLPRTCFLRGPILVPRDAIAFLNFEVLVGHEHFVVLDVVLVDDLDDLLLVHGLLQPVARLGGSVHHDDVPVHDFGDTNADEVVETTSPDTPMTNRT
jgi:hypothetical protein